MINRRSLVASVIGAAAMSGAAQARQPANAKPLSAPFRWREGAQEAPFGGAVSPAIVNYNRVAPYVANGGLLLKGGLEEAQQLGFKLIIDLRRPDENGVEEEGRAARRLGIAYRNIPFLPGEKAWASVSEYGAAIEDDENYPILAHCVSSNRSGAIWALCRARQGVPPLIAIEEGRAAGLKSREGFSYANYSTFPWSRRSALTRPPKEL